MLSESHPFIRRVIRFIALPFFFARLVYKLNNTVPAKQILSDLLYIFFKLKYFPYNYSLCRLWEKDRESWSFYYGSLYDPYQRHSLRKEVLPKKYRDIYRDKSKCYKICKDYALPVPRQFAVIGRNENYKERIRHIINENHLDKVIAKPILGFGGKGIVLISNNNGNIMVNNGSTIVSLNDWQLNSPSVVQEYIVQHEELSQMSKSINTIRIVTILKKNGEVEIVGALMRFGVGSSFIDNTSQGGVKAGINIESGLLNEIGHDSNSKQYKVHPSSQIKFQGFSIPKWKDVVSLAIDVQTKIPQCKLLGQDIAITPEGPIIVELNEEYDNVGLEQACGPIFKNKNIWKVFESYNLFINDFQKQLY